MGATLLIFEFFMGQSHMSPKDSIKAVNALKAKHMIPMHYGTFDLSDEPLGDPIHVLKEEEEKQHVHSKIMYVCTGEVIEVNT
jgi:L-ascorbate metabolism protein UlaG (beta-lactamase superfamily)